MDKSKKITEMNRLFDEKLMELVSLKGYNTQFFTKTSYTEMIEKIKSLKCKVSNKKPEHYQRLRRFDVMTIEETEKLIVPMKEDNVIKLYVHNDEIFKILHDTHIAIGHGGRCRMEKKINFCYKNITRDMIVLYLNLCVTCQKKRNVPTKGLLVKPILGSEVNVRCQVDLIDMQSQGDDEYKFILVYQDHHTKFVQLRPLKSNIAKEVAGVLLDIFTIFGAPSILHSDNGRAFVNKIIQEVSDMWPEVKIVHGRPGHFQIPETEECANKDIENMLSSWLESNNHKKWSEGLRFVQLMKNAAYHADINRSPYKAMFGSSLKLGLKSSSIPQETLKIINSEEDLEKVLKTKNVETMDDTEIHNRTQTLLQPLGHNNLQETADTVLSSFKNQDPEISENTQSEALSTILISNPISLSEINILESNVKQERKCDDY